MFLLQICMAVLRSIFLDFIFSSSLWNILLFLSIFAIKSFNCGGRSAWGFKPTETEVLIWVLCSSFSSSFLFLLSSLLVSFLSRYRFTLSEGLRLRKISSTMICRFSRKRRRRYSPSVSFILFPAFVYELAWIITVRFNPEREIPPPLTH